MKLKMYNSAGMTRSQVMIPSRLQMVGSVPGKPEKQISRLTLECYSLRKLMGEAHHSQPRPSSGIYPASCFIFAQPLTTFDDILLIV